MSALPAPLLAGGLAAVGVIAAGPGSALLAGAKWPTRRPTAALVLWQAVCLCAGLSLIGAAFVLGVAPLGDHLPEALVTLAGNTFRGRPFDGLSAWRVVLLGLAVVFALVLLGILVRCTLLALSRRRGHRQLLDLLTAGPAPRGAEPVALPAEVRVLDHAAPMAYSVPGWHTRLVLTAGLVDLLTPEQLAAVIGHERAHLRSHHDLLLLPFQAWAVALGRLPGVRASRQAVSTLAEMQADDMAARGTDPDAVASALAAVVLAGSERIPGVASGSELPEVGGTAVVARVTRLRDPRPLGTAATTLVGVAAAVLLLVPTLVLVIGWS